MRALPDYLDRDGLVKFWPILRDGDDSLTAYVLAIGDEAGWPVPEDARGHLKWALCGRCRHGICEHRRANRYKRQA